MSSTVHVRPYVADDRGGVRALVRDTFGVTTNFDRYETGNPLGQPLRVVAVRGDQVVGFNQWNAWLVHTAEGPVTAYQSGTSAVAVSCRGQGVFARLLAEGTRVAHTIGVPMFIGFPNPASHRSFLKDGWTHIKSLSLYVSALPAARIARGNVAVTVESPFARWRYRTQEIRCDQVGRRAAYHVREVRHGVPVVRLLDVLSEVGERLWGQLGRTALRVSGPALVYTRATRRPSPTMLRVARKWETPLIVKRIEGDARTLALVESADYLFGDIDAA